MGGGFAALSGALATAFDDVGWSGIEIVDVPVEVPPGGLERVDVLCPMGSSISGALMDATTPRMIQQFGVGLSGVDLPARRRARDYPVDNVSGAESGNAVAVAEIALLHLLALLRRFDEAQANVARRVVGEPSGTHAGGPHGRRPGGRRHRRRGDRAAARLRRRARRHRASPADRDAPGRRPCSTTSTTTAPATCSPPSPAATTSSWPARSPTRRGGSSARDALEALGPRGHVVNVARGAGRRPRRPARRAARRDGSPARASTSPGSSRSTPTRSCSRENVAVTPHVGGVTETSYAGIARGFRGVGGAPPRTGSLARRGRFAVGGGG